MQTPQWGDNDERYDPQWCLSEDAEYSEEPSSTNKNDEGQDLVEVEVRFQFLGLEPLVFWPHTWSTCRRM